MSEPTRCHYGFYDLETGGCLECDNAEANGTEDCGKNCPLYQAVEEKP